MTLARIAAISAITSRLVSALPKIKKVDQATWIMPGPIHISLELRKRIVELIDYIYENNVGYGGDNEKM